MDAFLNRTLTSIAQRTAALGRAVTLDASVLDRSAAIALQPPGLISANGSCRMIRARDNWLAVNLPREDDHAAIPALLETDGGGDAWSLLDALAPEKSCAHLVQRAELLGLAIAEVGEQPAAMQACSVTTRPASPRSELRVVDLSTLWAGPLCGAVFAAMGAEIVKAESLKRPDTTAKTAPAFDQRLNGAKRRLTLSFTSSDDMATLREMITDADIVITSARARAFDALGLTPDTMFARNPSLIWIAITGHGWDSARVAFGDDAAAAGGLVDWRSGAPLFIGDAIADPLTGLAAADAALALIQSNQAGFIDASLVQSAAHAASMLRVAA